MQKFELLSIKCKMCDWEWEITPKEKEDNIFCEHCGSDNVFVKHENLKMLKKNGKFLVDIGFLDNSDRFDFNHFEDPMQFFDKPLLVVKENDFRLPVDMSNEDRITILGKIDSIRSRILDDIRTSNDESFTHLK